jgi:single-stranded-DNA-specific exonuclease
MAPPEPALGAGLARGLGISTLLAQLLINRGVRTLPEGRRFLQPNLDGLLDPALLAGIPEAVDRLRRACRDRERIAIYGDYDADGLTGTALLYRALRLFGADPFCYIPHRLTEGYGLNIDAVERLASSGASILLTVDCGSSDAEEIRRAAALGLDVIVTDHHEVPDPAPEPLALINPKRPGTPYAGGSISGAAVAFKLAWALLQTLPESSRRAPAVQEFLIEAMSLVALGTVADVVPLLGESRIFAAYGMGAMRHCKNAGLRALIARSGIDDREPILTSHLAFRLGPRLNAGGRLGSPEPCLRLFLTEDPAEAEAIAEALDKTNTDRQRVEARILEEARDRIRAEFNLSADRAFVLADARWHAGVIGIVAARLVDEFRRPVILVALSGDRGKGSGRSIPGFPLHEALARCRACLHGYGGHAMAAGLEIDREQIPSFRSRLIELARDAFPDNLPHPSLPVDAEVTINQIGLSLAREMGRLGPHGAGNPTPVLAVRDAQIAGAPRRMGRGGNHVSFVAHQHGATLRAVWWGAADELDRRLNGSRRCDMAFTLATNSWSGTETVELIVQDLVAR